ncbi:ATP-dependent Clp protease, protease subunit [Plasmodium inui San Antonio 1]|uniref:ATP-dependent Clp protease proteolytic subunit n=1 Tax=Plasmodium inui San Antonio 1 TaxID=1237626 RepID=W7AMI9_9APIC|nr:ATP-dependent Clp protease, protease subunit [Plasmodium inui San Antonio 1]EUD66501.1 ATP-dependent Clp protease, protease subunit [Plasmodium inui San Antonio 1]
MPIYLLLLVGITLSPLCAHKGEATARYSYITSRNNVPVGRLRNLKKSRTKLLLSPGEHNEHGIRIPSLLLSKRIIFLSSPVYPHISEQIISQLLYLEYESKRKPIHLYINSTGDLENNKIINLNGITDVISIIDVIDYISSDVYTYCLGKAYGISCILASSGKKGFRFSLKNSSFCLNQSYSVIPFNQATNIEIQNKEIMNTKRKVVEIIANNTGKEKSHIERILERDRYFSATEAVEFNLVDHILEKE